MQERARLCGRVLPIGIERHKGSKVLQAVIVAVVRGAHEIAVGRG